MQGAVYAPSPSMNSACHSGAEFLSQGGSLPAVVIMDFKLWGSLPRKRRRKKHEEGGEGGRGQFSLLRAYYVQTPPGISLPSSSLATSTPPQVTSVSLHAVRVRAGYSTSLSLCSLLGSRDSGIHLARCLRRLVTEGRGLAPGAAHGSSCQVPAVIATSVPCLHLAVEDGRGRRALPTPGTGSEEAGRVLATPVSLSFLEKNCFSPGRPCEWDAAETPGSCHT